MRSDWGIFRSAVVLLVAGLQLTQPASPKSAVPSPPVNAPTPAAPFGATPTAVGSWSFTVQGHLPGEVETRVLARDGTLLAQKQYPPEWTRVGGSDACGGPMTTQPITLQLPGRLQ